MNNFTQEYVWRTSLYIRFKFKDISSTKNLDLVNYFDKLTCFQFFDSNINEDDLTFLKAKNKNEDIYFKYIDADANFLKIIKESGFNVEVISLWEAGQLHIKKGKFSDYCSSKSNNFKRLIRKYLTKSKSLMFVSANSNNLFKLWKDILYIDQSSWKYEEESDMLNMDYEHLQYIFLCLSNSYSVDILVAYIEDEPIAYSFLLKDKGIYYAVKWGATKIGRLQMGGICCLIKQIENISRTQDLYMDFWGRDNTIYDRLKTHSKERMNFMIRSKNENKNS